MEGDVRELGDTYDLGLPGGAESLVFGFLPMGMGERVERDRLALHRTQQADAALDLAVVEQEARRGHLHRGTAGLAVDQQPGARIARAIERLRERERAIAVAAADREDTRLGTALRVGVDRAALDDREALGGQCLDAEVIGAG